MKFMTNESVLSLDSAKAHIQLMNKYERDILEFIGTSSMTDLQIYEGNAFGLLEKVYAVQNVTLTERVAKRTKGILMDDTWKYWYSNP